MIDVRTEGRVRIVTFTGELTPEELLKYSVSTVNSGSFDPGMDSLVDLRALTGMTVSSIDIGETERLFAERTRGVHRRLAIVVGSPVTLGFARAYQIQHSESGDVTEIFNELDDARRWLGLAPLGAGS
jgi:hypothetical protein